MVLSLYRRWLGWEVSDFLSFNKNNVIKIFICKGMRHHLQFASEIQAYNKPRVLMHAKAQSILVWVVQLGTMYMLPWEKKNKKTLQFW